MIEYICSKDYINNLILQGLYYSYVKILILLNLINYTAFRYGFCVAGSVFPASVPSHPGGCWPDKKERVSLS